MLSPPMGAELQRTRAKALRTIQCKSMLVAVQVDPVMSSPRGGRQPCMQKLIVVRCIQTGRVTLATVTLVGAKLEPRLSEPPPSDLVAFYDESLCMAPLLFIRTPGMEPMGQPRALAAPRQMQWRTTSLGQGQEPKPATRHECAGQGFWALLVNCHLDVPWLPDIAKLIGRVGEDKPYGQSCTFLSSSPTLKFPIQTCIKVTSEPPKSCFVVAPILGLPAVGACSLIVVVALRGHSSDSSGRLRGTCWCPRQPRASAAIRVGVEGAGL